MHTSPCSLFYPGIFPSRLHTFDLVFGHFSPCLLFFPLFPFFPPLIFFRILHSSFFISTSLPYLSNIFFIFVFSGAALDCIAHEIPPPYISGPGFSNPVDGMYGMEMGWLDWHGWNRWNRWQERTGCSNDDT